MEHDKGITNFHFEVAADLLNEEELQLIEKMRPGLIQLEIGVQSTNEKTIREIRRTMKIREGDPPRIHTDIENLGKAILNIINRYNSKAE